MTEMNTESNRPGSLLMLASSMLIFGTIGIFRRYIPLPSGLLAFSRGAIGAVFLGLFLKCRGAWQQKQKAGSGEGSEGGECGEGAGSRGGRKNLQLLQRKAPAGTMLLLILSGALIGVNWILLFEAYNYTTVATATLCYYMEPTIVILLSPLFFGERLTAKKLICALLAVLGMFLVSGAAGQGFPQGNALLGILYGLGAAVLYAAVVIMNKCIRNVDPYLKTILQLASASVCITPYLAVTGQFSHVQLDRFSLLMLLIVGLVHTGIAYTLYFGSTDGLKAQTIALFSYIDPGSALFFSMLFLHEPMSAAGLAGAALILGAAFAAER
jgi:RarD protein